MRVNGRKIGRNEPRVCGSGRKFKVCCIEKALAVACDAAARGARAP